MFDWFNKPSVVQSLASYLVNTACSDLAMWLKVIIGLQSATISVLLIYVCLTLLQRWKVNDRNALNKGYPVRTRKKSPSSSATLTGVD